MRVIDFHSHILPGIDDGSRDRTMSIEMLDAAYRQRIDVMVATPHFYADRMSFDKFLENREKAFHEIIDDADDREIFLVKGAEVAFFSGIGGVNRLEELCIDQTNVILIEMPFREWTDRDIQEIQKICNRGLQPVMAHLERFYSYQKKNKDIIEELLELPVYIQVNAESLLSFMPRQKILKLFKVGDAHLLGSDCHNVTTRSQNLAQAREILSKKMGNRVLYEIDELGAKLLNL